jgi:hypothetical protein
MEPDGEFKATRSPNEIHTGPSMVIPAAELKGSPQERLRTLDAALSQLQHLRSTLIGEAPVPSRYELRGRHIDAPVWPWFTAGWVLGALFVVLLLLARSYA